MTPYSPDEKVTHSGWGLHIFYFGSRKAPDVHFIHIYHYSVHTDLVADCHGDAPYCVDEIEVDWYGNGYQHSTLRRGCSATPARETCYEDQNSRLKVGGAKNSCHLGLIFYI